MIALNPPSLARFEPLLVPGGLLIVNSTLIEAEARRTDIEVAAIPCTALARAGDDDRFVSVVALGGLIACRPIVGRESLRQALIDVLGDKRPEMIDANLAAFDSGYAAAIDAAGVPASGSTGLRAAMAADWAGWHLTP